jgi:predicted dienelactone hydrolase
VLFAHGYDVTPDFYAPLLERWAAAGYVVAAPVFPILSGSDGGASHVDYEKTFGDASFVITQVLQWGGGDPLAGMVDPDRIAAAGHSDGEVVSFGVGFLECCRDPRVRSVIAMAGDLSNANNP